MQVAEFLQQTDRPIRCSSLTLDCEEHLKKTFLRTSTEKLKIIKDRQPCPPLSNLKSVHKDIKDTYTRNFQVLYYDFYLWLT
jgi:hypothetical protein